MDLKHKAEEKKVIPGLGNSRRKGEGRKVCNKFANYKWLSSVAAQREAWQALGEETGKQIGTRKRKTLNFSCLTLE